MPAWPSARPGGASVEIARGAAVAITSFAIVAVAVAAVDGVLDVLVGVACLAAVILVDRRWDIAYAVPVAIAALVAFDWFQFPPTHPHRLPDAANLGNLAVYLAAGVLVGRLAASAARRADAGEAGRRELLEEQAALRRVATLVARQAPPADVFAKVAEEVSHVLGTEAARVVRYEADGQATIVGNWAPPDDPADVGARVAVEGESVTAQVHRTGRPARVDNYARATGILAETARAEGFLAGVGAPIVVEGRLWGAMIALSRRLFPLPPGTEERIGKFTELVATAIANVEARTELADSRARIVAAADEERRRVVRDLHDGAQQRLVHTIITISMARNTVARDPRAAGELLSHALDQAQQANDELRELAHGIMPAVLLRGGLEAGVDALASRMPVPVDVGVDVGRLPPAVEATAYFVVAEALTNVAKHARAQRAVVEVRVGDGRLQVQVRDDGVGGARREGSGLVGLRDRLAVLDGRLDVRSDARGGTLVAAAIPLTESARSADRRGDHD